MVIKAKVTNDKNNNEIFLQTNDNTHSIIIPPKTNGFGSSVNGGELLFLSLATCYSNDIYREASKMGIKVESVEVEVSGNFGLEGEPAKNIRYDVKVIANTSVEMINELIYLTDKKAEIQNTLRIVNNVTLNHAEAISISK